MTICSKSTLKKYNSRPGPPYPAQQCRNQTKKGNDGMEYKSVADSRGIYKWMKTTSRGSNKKLRPSAKLPKLTGKKYYIHDNGNRPYTVTVNKNTVQVYKNKIDKNENPVPVELLMEKRVEKIYETKDISKDSEDYKPNFDYFQEGNTILCKLKKDIYMFIGNSGIFTFETAGDEIREYYSVVGNNDVPYPWAVGEKNTYLMIENDMLPNEKLEPHRDPYRLYYNLDKKHSKLKKLGKKLLKIKQLYERQLNMEYID